MGADHIFANEPGCIFRLIEEDIDDVFQSVGEERGFLVYIYRDLEGLHILAFELRWTESYQSSKQ